MTTFAEVAEGVKATIARYAQALDDGRTDDVVSTFCADGSADIPGLGVHTGHDALREAFREVEPRSPQRHLVVNTLLSDWSEDRALAVSDVVVLGARDGRWSVIVVGRYEDELHPDGDQWRFHRRTATFLV